MTRCLPTLVAASLLAIVPGCGSDAEGEYREVTARSPSRATDSTGDDGPAHVADPDRLDPDGGIQQVAAMVVEDSVPKDEPADPAVEPVTDASEKPAGRTVKSLVPEPEFRREKNGSLRVTFDDLDLKRVIGIDRPTMDTPELMPGWQRRLSGERIRIRGFMYPVFDQVLTNFILTRDNGICCFGPEAKLYDQITVSLKEGTETEYIQNTPFDVEGTFAIQPYEIDGDVVVYYILEDAVVHRR